MPSSCRVFGRCGSCPPAALTAGECTRFSSTRCSREQHALTPHTGVWSFMHCSAFRCHPHPSTILLACAACHCAVRCGALERCCS
jgi:hypothetical protein